MIITYQTKNPVLFAKFFSEVNLNELEQKRKDFIGGPSRVVEVVFLMREPGTEKGERFLSHDCANFTKVLEYYFCDVTIGKTGKARWKRQLRVVLE